MKIKLMFFVLLGLAMINGQAFAGCSDEIEKIRPQFIAAHEKLSEEMHLEAEKLFGEAVSFCMNDREGNAILKLDELKVILGI